MKQRSQGYNQCQHLAPISHIIILQKELLLATDAKAYGLGCVLSDVMPDGNKKAIAFASRTLNVAEKGYP